MVNSETALMLRLYVGLLDLKNSSLDTDDKSYDFPLDHLRYFMTPQGTLQNTVRWVLDVHIFNHKRFCWLSDWSNVLLVCENV